MKVTSTLILGIEIDRIFLGCSWHCEYRALELFMFFDAVMSFGTYPKDTADLLTVTSTTVNLW